MTQHRDDGWVHFLHLYTKVIEDIPLDVAVPAAKKKPKRAAPASGPKYISHVTVNFEEPREAIKHEGEEELRFKVT